MKMQNLLKKRNAVIFLQAKESKTNTACGGDLVLIIFFWNAVLKRKIKIVLNLKKAEMKKQNSPSN